MDARRTHADSELTQGFHKRKIDPPDRGVRPTAAPLEELLDWCTLRQRVQRSGYHVCFTRSRSPVQTRHPV